MGAAPPAAPSPGPPPPTPPQPPRPPKPLLVFAAYPAGSPPPVLTQGAPAVVVVRCEGTAAPERVSLALASSRSFTSWGDVALGSARVDADGSASVSLSLPADTPVGDYTLVARAHGAGGGVVTPGGEGGGGAAASAPLPAPASLPCRVQPPRPFLACARVGGSQLEVSWPLNALPDG